MTMTHISHEVRPRRPETPLDSSSISSSTKCLYTTNKPCLFDSAPLVAPSASITSSGPNPEPTPDPSPVGTPVNHLDIGSTARLPNVSVSASLSPTRPSASGTASPQLWSKSTTPSPQLWMPKPKRNNGGWLSRNTSQESLARQGFMSAYPNSAPRHGGVSHYDYGTDSSCPGSAYGSSANLFQHNAPALIESVRHNRTRPLFRQRQSSHASSEWTCTSIGHGDESDSPKPCQSISDFDEMATDSELDDMELELPEDALWITTKKRNSSLRSPLYSHARAGTPTHDHHEMPAVPENAPLPATRPALPPRVGAHVMLPRRRPTIGNDDSEYFGGRDIVYTRCSSPETVHLETDQLYHKVCEIEQSRRDHSGKSGLWGGYCVSSAQTAPKGPQMLSTPRPEAVPSLDPFSAAFTRYGTCDVSSPSSLSPALSPRHHLSRQTSLVQQAALRRAAQKAEQAVLDEKIRDEFTTHFVTQVYNYLSLGYPAMARAYDAELAKITGVAVRELRRDDDVLLTNGHFVDEVDPEDDVKREDEGEKKRCPRWCALRAYVHEWARQHPNLDTLDPLVWGLQERRGSWGV